MSDPERDDELWGLLGKAKPTQVSPFFARNVLRRIREQQEARPRFVSWVFARQRRWAALAAALLLMAGGSALLRDRSAPGEVLVLGDPQPERAEPVTQEIAASPDYEIIVQLDELLAYERNTLWIDDSTSY